MSGRILVERDGAIGWIVFDQRERRNAITLDMWRDIPRAAAEVDADDAVRVVVLRGAGEEAFVAGADISEFENVRSGEGGADYEVENQRAFGALLAIRKPVLAMIHGFCFGGGVGIAITADLRYAADDALFSIPAGRLGIGYPVSGLETLANVVGFSTAKELFFTARRLHAREALERHLVTAVAPKADLEKTVRETAAAIAEKAPLTLRSIKLVLDELAKDPALRDHDAMARSIRECFASEDYREGVRAFLEKRRPVFRGR